MDQDSWESIGENDVCDDTPKKLQLEQWEHIEDESKKIFKSRQDEQWQQLDHDEVDAYKITKLQPLLYKSTKQNKKDKLSNEESLMNQSFNKKSIEQNQLSKRRNSDLTILQRIKVTDPTKHENQVIYYKIFAFDTEGQFECLRRFSDFESLREAWRKRLPGLYVPFLPPKKFFGNTDKTHLEERCFGLEQFLKKVYRTSYLIGSEEFQFFARHSQADVAKFLDELPIQNINMLTFRIKKANPVIQHQISQHYKLLMNNVIEECKEFTKNHLSMMEDTRKLIKSFTVDKDQYMDQNTNFVCEQLILFEENHLNGLINTDDICESSSSMSSLSLSNADDQDKFVLDDLVDTNPQRPRKGSVPVVSLRESVLIIEQETPFMRQQQQNMLSSFENPFKLLHLWAAQEVLDLKALQEAFLLMEMLEEKRKKLMRSISMSDEDVNALRPALIQTAKSMFGSSGDAEAETLNKKLASSFEVQKEIVHYVEINEYLTQFHAKHLIPVFKAEKVMQYKLIMKEFARLESQNNEQIKNMWKNILDHHQDLNM